MSVSTARRKIRATLPAVVLGLRYSLHMIWIHARTNLAEMVNMEPGRYLANERFVRDSVGSQLLCAISKLPVAVVDEAQLPNPTAVFGDLDVRENPVLQGHIR